MDSAADVQRIGEKAIAKNLIEFDLDILGNKVTVDVGHLSHDAIGQMRFGFMDATAQEITINETVDPTWRVYLLLHEVIHALSFMGHLQFLKREDIPYMDDESKVDAIASLIAEVLTRNNLFRTEVFHSPVDKLKQVK